MPDLPDPTPPKPTATPVAWYRSRLFTGLWQASVLMTLMWTMSGLQSGVWDWKAGLVIPILANVIVVFRDMSNPNIVGLFDFQNKNNK